MNRDDDTLPYRQATRVVNAFQFEVGQLPLSHTGLNLDRSILLLAFLRMALRHPGTTKVSLNGLATSLHRPAETMRRAAWGLAERGFCFPAPRGIRLADDFLTQVPVQALTQQVVAAFDRMLDRLEGDGFTLPPRVRDAGSRAEAAIDIYLSAFELTESRLNEPMTLYILAAVTVGNASIVGGNPVLAEQYGYRHTVPPDALRRPVSLREIAGLDGFAYSTLWRTAVALEKQGLIRRTRSGYLLGDIFMDDPVTSDRSVEKIKYVRRILQDLSTRAGR